MLNAEIKKELDVLVGAIDERIDKKIDEREVETQKSVFNQTSKVDFQKKLANAIDKNKGYREWELKADELFVSEATGTYVQPQYEVGIKGTPFVSDLRSLLPQSTTNSDTVTVNRGVYNANNGAIVLEGASIPESTNTLTAVNFTIDKLAHKFQVSEEFLKDVDGASQFISNQITGGLIEKMNGNIITDIKANDTAFDTTSSAQLYQAIESAQEYDVLMATLNQMRIGNYIPDLILVHPTDYAKMQLLKSSQNEYLGISGTVDGVRVAQSSSITAGEFHVMDSVRYGRYYNNIPLSVQFGFEGSDFGNDTRTVKAVHRGVLAVLDVNACITGTFSTAKTSLETA